MRFPVLALALAIAAAPGAASAITFGTTNNIESGESYALQDGPFFFQSSFADSDVAGQFLFTFTNTSNTSQMVAASSGTVLQDILTFFGTGVVASWDNGETAFIQPAPPGDVTAGFTITSLLAAGGQDILRIVYGDPVERIAGGLGDIDFNVHGVVSAIPLPAPFLLLFGALGGLVVLGRRRKSAAA